MCNLYIIYIYIFDIQRKDNSKDTKKYAKMFD